MQDTNTCDEKVKLGLAKGHMKLENQLQDLCKEKATFPALLQAMPQGNLKDLKLSH